MTTTVGGADSSGNVCFEDRLLLSSALFFGYLYGQVRGDGRNPLMVVHAHPQVVSHLKDKERVSQDSHLATLVLQPLRSFEHAVIQLVRPTDFASSNISNSLAYGQTVRLKHCFSNLYISLKSQDDIDTRGHRRHSTVSTPVAPRRKQAQIEIPSSVELHTDRSSYEDSQTQLFRVLPKYSKIRKEGDAVRIGDQVIFQHLESGRVLAAGEIDDEQTNCDSIGIHRGKSESTLGLIAPKKESRPFAVKRKEAEIWTIHGFHKKATTERGLLGQQEVPDEPEVVQAGGVVALHHVESDCFLSITKQPLPRPSWIPASLTLPGRAASPAAFEDSQRSEPPCRMPGDPFVEPRSEISTEFSTYSSLWVLERDEPQKGGEVTLHRSRGNTNSSTSVFMLRHLESDSYLATSESRGGHVLTTVKSKEKQSQDCFIRFLPDTSGAAKSDDHDVLGGHTLVRIQFANSKLLLHIRKNQDATLSNRVIYEDLFVIRPLPVSFAYDLTTMMSSVATLKICSMIHPQLRRARRLREGTLSGSVSPKGQPPILTVASASLEVLKFVKSTTDDLTRPRPANMAEGSTPDQITAGSLLCRQQLLLDTQFHVLTFNLLLWCRVLSDILNDSSSDSSYSSDDGEAASELQEIDNKVAEVSHHCYAILMHLCLTEPSRSNYSPSAGYLAPWIPLISHLVGGESIRSSKYSETGLRLLMAILKDKINIISNIPENDIRLCIDDLMPFLNTPSAYIPRLFGDTNRIAVLTCLCVCNGSSIIDNQNLVTQRIQQANHSLLYPSRVKRGRILVYLPTDRRSFGTSAQRKSTMPLNNQLLSMTPLEKQYKSLRNLGSEWVDLAKLMYGDWRHNTMAYFSATRELLHSISHNNEAGAEFVRKHVSAHEVLLGVVLKKDDYRFPQREGEPLEYPDQTYADPLRAAYVRLCRAAYIGKCAPDPGALPKIRRKRGAPISMLSVQKSLTDRKEDWIRAPPRIGRRGGIYVSDTPPIAKQDSTSEFRPGSHTDTQAVRRILLESKYLRLLSGELYPEVVDRITLRAVAQPQHARASQTQGKHVVMSNLNRLFVLVHGTLISKTTGISHHSPDILGEGCLVPPYTPDEFIVNTDCKLFSVTPQQVHAILRDCQEFYQTSKKSAIKRMISESQGTEFQIPMSAMPYLISELSNTEIIPDGTKLIQQNEVPERLVVITYGRVESDSKLLLKPGDYVGVNLLQNTLSNATAYAKGTVHITYATRSQLQTAMRSDAVGSTTPALSLLQNDVPSKNNYKQTLDYVRSQNVSPSSSGRQPTDPLSGTPRRGSIDREKLVADSNPTSYSHYIEVEIASSYSNSDSMGRRRSSGAVMDKDMYIDNLFCNDDSSRSVMEVSDDEDDDHDLTIEADDPLRDPNWLWARYQLVKGLKNSLKAFLSQNAVVETADVAKNVLMAEWLQLLSSLIDLGQYDDEELDNILPLLADLLDTNENEINDSFGKVSVSSAQKSVTSNYAFPHPLGNLQNSEMNNEPRFDDQFNTHSNTRNRLLSVTSVTCSPRSLSHTISAMTLNHRPSLSGSPGRSFGSLPTQEISDIIPNVLRQPSTAQNDQQPTASVEKENELLRIQAVESSIVTRTKLEVCRIFMKLLSQVDNSEQRGTGKSDSPGGALASIRSAAGGATLAVSQALTARRQSIGSSESDLVSNLQSILLRVMRFKGSRELFVTSFRLYILISANREKLPVTHVIPRRKLVNHLKKELANHDEDLSSNTLLVRLVEHCKTYSHHGHNDSALTQSEENETIIAALGCIRDVIINDDNCGLTREQRQTKLNSLEAMWIVINTVDSRSSGEADEEVVKVGLELATALLEGGNQRVQAWLRDYFFSRRDETLFVVLRDRITKAIYTIDKVLATPNPHAHECFQGPLYHIEETMRFLQLCSEGHNTALQNYFRVQEDNVQSHDLVRETLKFLTSLNSIAREDKGMLMPPFCLRVAIQTWNTLTEFCQGPVPANQYTLIEGLIGRDVNTVFQICGEESLVADVLNAATVTMLSVVEGCTTPHAPLSLRYTLDLDLLLKCLIDIPEDNREDTEFGYNMYLLLCFLRDYDAYDTSGMDVGHMLSSKTELLFYKDRTAQVEILREGSGLERVYFRKPSACLCITKRTKDYLIENVHRETHQSRLVDFFDRVEETAFELNIISQTERSTRTSARKRVSLANAIHLRSTKIRTIGHCLVLLCNVLLLFVSTPGHAQSLPLSFLLANSTFVMFGSNVQIPRYLNVVISGCICTLILIFFSGVLEFVWFEGPVLVFMRDRERRRKSGKYSVAAYLNPDHVYRLEDPNWSFGDSVSVAHVVRKCIWEPRFLRLILGILACIFALSVSPFFASTLLIPLIAESSVIRHVASAVTRNGKSLILTMLLGVILMYLFAVVGFVLFRDMFIQGDENHCSTMLRCFIFTVTSGLRAGGGIGELIQSPTWGSELHAIRVIYDMSFYILVTVIFMNIVFGIIVDTFGELRQKREGREQELRTHCFICNVPSSEYDKRADGFSNHVNRDHNMWNYMFFVFYIANKPRDELTGQESFVYNCLIQNDLRFIPVNTSLALTQDRLQGSSEIKEKEYDAADLSRDDFELLGTRIENLESKVATQYSIIEEHLNQISRGMKKRGEELWKSARDKIAGRDVADLIRKATRKTLTRRDTLKSGALKAMKAATSPSSQKPPVSPSCRIADKESPVIQPEQPRQPSPPPDVFGFPRASTEQLFDDMTNRIPSYEESPPRPLPLDLSAIPPVEEIGASTYNPFPSRMNTGGSISSPLLDVGSWVGANPSFAAYDEVESLDSTGTMTSKSSLFGYGCVLLAGKLAAAICEASIQAIDPVRTIPLGRSANSLFSIIPEVIVQSPTAQVCHFYKSQCKKEGKKKKKKE
eukprot:TRINITY_DN16422_c0_g1_i2.p1 TRINITY_DN16422_c0_g1~~TRINITY_DN16422_c0_g1_i2.p1  ORF type:complete len:2879 (+),score=387.34 TRINITY_DN16422_c0_g1_i2:29-8665(+)